MRRRGVSRYPRCVIALHAGTPETPDLPASTFATMPSRDATTRNQCNFGCKCSLWMINEAGLLAKSGDRHLDIITCLAGIDRVLNPSGTSTIFQAMSRASTPASDDDRRRDSGEMLFIGQRCAHDACSLVDFLPLKVSTLLLLCRTHAELVFLAVLSVNTAASPFAQPTSRHQRIRVHQCPRRTRSTV